MPPATASAPGSGAAAQPGAVRALPGRVGRAGCGEPLVPGRRPRLPGSLARPPAVGRTAITGAAGRVLIRQAAADVSDAGRTSAAGLQLSARTQATRHPAGGTHQPVVW